MSNTNDNNHHNHQSDQSNINGDASTEQLNMDKLTDVTNLLIEGSKGSEDSQTEQTIQNGKINERFNDSDASGEFDENNENGKGENFENFDEFDEIDEIDEIDGENEKFEFEKEPKNLKNLKKSKKENDSSGNNDRIYNDNNNVLNGNYVKMLPIVKQKNKKNMTGTIDKKRINYMPIHICAFAIPFVLMIIAFSTAKIFPFGDKQIMVVDSWHQYYPFLQELQYKLTHGQSLLYSWNTGAGTNFLTLMSYYASTPTYLLSMLWPADYLREFMMVITAAKIACSGLFFSIYLRGLYSHDYLKKPAKSGDAEIPYTELKRCSLNIGLAILGFSILYAVSAYAVGYYWCIMFLDGMALLPLIILGLERLIDSGKFKLYAISLGIAVIASYYIAIFICIFVLVYFFVLYFMKTSKPSIFGLVMKGLKVLGASLIGIGLSAAVLLPTFLWFGNTGNAGSKFSESITTYNTLLDIITHLLPATKPAVRAGLPNIACGLITLIFAGLYFVNPKIKTKDKVVIGGFFVFMLFSFNINILNFIWHGGHYPNEIPYRQAFVFSFVLATVGFKSFVAFKGSGITKKTVWILCLCIFGYLVFAEQWYGKSSDKFDFKVFYISIALLIVYMIVLLFYKNKKFSANYLAAVLIFAMIFEGGMSAVKGAEATGTSGRDGYPPSKENVRKTVKDIYEADDEKFFRLEMSRWYSTNDPALYGYRGVSQFSSEANGKFARTLEILGLAASVGSNRYLYSSATPVFNMFLSLKYLMTRDDEPKYELNSAVFDEFLHNETTDIIEGESGEADTSVSSDPVTAYKNKYWLPLGFMVSEDIKETDVNQINPFILQNDLMRNAAGVNGDIFKSIYQQYNDNNNLDEYPGEYGVYSYRNKDKAQKAMVTHYYTSDITQQVYMYVKAGRGKDASVSINGSSKTYEVNRGITIDCGKVLAGQEVKVSFELEASDGGTYYVFVAGFDEDLFASAYNILNTGTLDVTDFKDTNIKGTITAYNDGLMFVSIPYDKGWHVKIDGKEAQINPKPGSGEDDVNANVDILNKNITNNKTEDTDIRKITQITDGFVTVPLSAGTHNIEFYYVTDGLVPGIILMLLSILLIIGWDMLTRYNQKNNNRLTEKMNNTITNIFDMFGSKKAKNTPNISNNANKEERSNE